jgi:hypothetical protein
MLRVPLSKQEAKKLKMQFRYVIGVQSGLLQSLTWHLVKCCKGMFDFNFQLLHCRPQVLLY